MVFFITFLKALAACLITNSHYTGIYPTDLIANGGLIGDVLFFAVSGYCLYQVKKPFAMWYGKRLVRCYVPVIVMTAVYLLLGCYTTEEHGLLWWFVYPTCYHFVASIVILYIPYYFIMCSERIRNRLPVLMGLIAAVYLLLYLTVYDRSYYHIDNVREPMIRFLFMESMLLGAWFRRNDEKFRCASLRKRKVTTVVVTLIIICYFASKLLFARIPALSPFQPVNQLLIFCLLWSLLRWAAAWDVQLEAMPRWIKVCVEFIAARTLEIYVVQYVLIDLIRPLLGFPLNWFALTGAILAAASLLHWVCGKLIRLPSLLKKF
jgi:hypothetical protein